MKFENPNKNRGADIEELLSILAQKGVITSTDIQKIKARRIKKRVV